MDKYLTEGKDTFRQSPGDAWDTYFAQGGDDSVSLYQGTVVGGKGNDTITRLPASEWWRAVQVAYWDAPDRVTVDLAAGWALDGWGTRDTLVGVSDVSMSWSGGSVTGSAGANVVYLGGGGAQDIDGAGGEDTIWLPQFGDAPNYGQFVITVAIDGLSATITAPEQPQFSAVVRNVERIGLAGRWDEVAQLSSFIKPDDIAQQGLVAGDALRWNAGAALGTGVALTFSFVTEAPAGSANAAGFHAFNAAERQAVRDILGGLAAATGLAFTEVADGAADHGQLRFGASAQSATKGTATPPGVGGDRAGDVWLDVDTLAALAPGAEGYAALLHEIGHALGLRHPRNAEAGDAWAAQVRADIDGTALSVMSLTASPDGLFPSTFSAYDIAALRHLYGAGAVNTGDDHYRLDAARFQAQTGLVDDGGRDTLDASAASAGVLLDLTPGHWSSVGVTAAGLAATGNLSVGLDTWIEAAVGSHFDDVIVGNALDNELAGLQGNDWIDGGAGTDTAAYAGRRGDYLVSTGYGKVFIGARDGVSGFQTLLGVEQVRFADGLVALGRSALGADASATLDQDTTLAGTLPDPSDQARAGVTYTLKDGPAHGTVKLGTDGHYTYVPAAGYANADRFSYTLADAAGGTNTYNVYLTVQRAGGGAVATGTEGDDALAGLAGDDSINAGRGADRIAASDGYDHLDGGDGVDTVVYGGARAGYTIGRDGDRWTVYKPGNGADTLTGVERLTFGDTAVALDIDGVAGQAYRLYQAAFDRKPDLPGLGFWMTNMERGMSLDRVAYAFVQSAEFGALYGANVDNATLVTNLYQNVLHRAPEAAGLAFWKGLLDAGTISRAAALVGFSESAENQAALIGVVSQGMEYVPYA